MERLRQLISRINTQLSELTVSQRLAIGLCAALVAVSLLSLAQWSKQPEMVPLVTYEFTFEDLSVVEEALRTSNIPYEIVGHSRIFVRSADRHNALRVMNESDALPVGALFDMTTVVMGNNPFQPPQAREQAWTFAKGNELAKIIETSPAVKKASVLLNPTTKRRLGGTTDVPTASVTVTLNRGHEMNQHMVDAFAKLVAGAVAGLKPYNVAITDAGTLRSYHLPSPEDALSFDVLGMIKEREKHFRQKILDKLADIPGVLVAVTVELDMEKKITKKQKHEMAQVKLEKTNTTEQSTSHQPSEAGVQANLGTALTSGRSGQTNSTEETTTENFEPKLSETQTIERVPFGTNKVTATVGIPRSFVVGVFLAQQPEDTEIPKDDDPDYLTFRDAQIERVRTSVELIVMAQDSSDVDVDVYPDMEWTSQGGHHSRSPGNFVSSAETSITSTVQEMTTHYGPQIGMGMLALMSLFMMMRIARKSTDAIQPRRKTSSLPEPEEAILEVGPSTVGQAGISESMLQGKEVDSTTLRYQELGTEVSKMVEEDPEGTAELVRRWLTEPT